MDVIIQIPFSRVLFQNTFINIKKMFKQDKFKSTFLQKKQQEKKKNQQQTTNNLNLLKIQKNIKAFLIRVQLNKQYFEDEDIRMSLLFNNTFALYDTQQILKMASIFEPLNQNQNIYYLKKMVLISLQCKELVPLAFRLLQNQKTSEQVYKDKRFVMQLCNLLPKSIGKQLLIRSCKILETQNLLKLIKPNLIFDTILDQFNPSFVELEQDYKNILTQQAIQILSLYLSSTQFFPKSHNITSLVNFINYYSSILQPNEHVLSYLLNLYIYTTTTMHQNITAQFIKKHANLISMIEDEETLNEVEKKITNQPQMQIFNNEFLEQTQKIFHNKHLLQFFKKSHSLKQALLNLSKQLTSIFEHQQIIFLSQIICSDDLIKQLPNSSDYTLYEGLKMRLFSMDDIEFTKFNLFSTYQWKSIIKNTISLAHLKIQKLIQQPKAPSLIPFSKKSSDQVQLMTYIHLLNNLYKKILRTHTLNPQQFIDTKISNALVGFSFGKGAQRIQYSLKYLPFIFTFESRISKFKQIIKNDKKNYDRSLFLQQQPDEDLIIAVRRGNEFQDAFEACMTRDLRKKYKIIFFNEQGLEEEGVDGGGIIKQFINRVLKASFGSTYGLFYQNSKNQIIPNPYSVYTNEYEFVGRIVGKAVYQGINIEQKFCQPFLNLLIGRQNNFEDLQFIDEELYQGLIKLKHSDQNLSELEQSFVILDSLPNGQKKYIDLLNPHNEPMHYNTLVTNQNKLQFLLSYSDFKCNKQIEQKTKYFRRGFLKVMKPEWLTMFSNQELNLIISGSHPDFAVEQLKINTLYNDYHQKQPTIIYLWQVINQFTPEQKSLLLLFITSCSRPPTLGFSSMKPKICINRDQNTDHLPTANTCMNVLRLPDYKNKEILKNKLIYAITAKAGFQFA